MARTGEAALHSGWYISGAVHVALIFFILFGGLFMTDRIPEVRVSEVTVVTEEELAALSAPEAAPEIETSVPEASVPEEDTPPPAPEAETVPERGEPEVVEAPDTPDAPEIEVPQPVPNAVVVDDAPVIDTPDTDFDGTSLERDAVAAPAPRVAPTPSIAPPPLAEVAPERVEEALPDPEAPPEDEVEEQTPAAPPEASDRIVTEAEETRETAPASSMRPRARIARPVRRAETPAEEIAPDTTPDAIADAVAEANAPAEPDIPPGPPMTGGEKDAFALAVGGCWVVDSGGRSAEVVVTVAFNMSRDGKVEGDVRLVSAEGGTPETQRAAFQKARRAILRCQKGGYALPVEKYGQWREIEATFNPKGMQYR